MAEPNSLETQLNIYCDLHSNSTDRNTALFRGDVLPTGQRPQETSPDTTAPSPPWLILAKDTLAYPTAGRFWNFFFFNHFL